nr:hypothetical protein [Prevotella sp.]
MEEEDMNCTSGKNKLKTILNSHKIGEYTTEEETAFMTDLDYIILIGMIKLWV